MALWNPWHGCHKISTGCKNCYVYRMDAKYQRDASMIYKTGNFRLPVMKNRSGEYKIPSGTTVYTCFSSDFLLNKADNWRQEAWEMMEERSDLHFFFITKRIDRFLDCLPPNWGKGYENVSVGCTVENQDRVDFRLPLFSAAPIKYKYIICEPLLGAVNLSPYLDKNILQVSVGGESGTYARVCNYEWVLGIRSQCIAAGIPFQFRQTGACFEKDGRTYRIPRQLQHKQAHKANIDFAV